MNDIATILQDISNEPDLDADLAEACRDGAKEIERLRLTASERSAISFAADAYALNDDDHDCWRISNTLRGLLERLG